MILIILHNQPLITNLQNLYSLIPNPLPDRLSSPTKSSMNVPVPTTCTTAPLSVTVTPSSSKAKSGKALCHARRGSASSVWPEHWVWKAWSYHWTLGAQGERKALVWMLFEADQSLMERAMVDCFCDSGEKSGIILRAFAEGLGTNVLFDMVSRVSGLGTHR
jgi:hypothetical protein